MDEQASLWQASASIEVISRRARMLRDIRAFFDARQVMEVETPLLSAFATTDLHLQSFSTLYQDKKRYLNTSPEYAMKRLLALHQRAIYQVCKSFRVDEFGPNHNPEFTMLEWYQPGFSLSQLMDELEQLLVAIGIKGVQVQRMSYKKLFEQHAGLNPHTVTSGQCRDCALEYEIEIPVGLDDDVDEWLDWLLTQLVLPALNQEQFTIVFDYPQSQCALAKCVRNESDEIVAARFELFYGRIELANGFDELTDAQEQRRRFKGENDQRVKIGLSSQPVDRHLLEALEHGLPECSGIAVGLDRLLMMLCGEKQLADVLTFHWLNS